MTDKAGSPRDDQEAPDDDGARTDIERVLARRYPANRNNVGDVSTATLKDGPRAHKVAVLRQILRPDGSLHHHVLKLETYRRKEGSWWPDDEKSISLTTENKEGNEITRLLTFLRAYKDGQVSRGESTILSVSDGSVADAISSLTREERGPLLLGGLRDLASDGELGDVLALLGSDAADTLRELGTVARLQEFRAARDELTHLIDSEATTEHELQKLLEANPWMLGSEYSNNLNRRRWTRDEQADFMLRRTADAYLEIIEVKRASGVPVLRFDASHQCHYPSSELSKVIGQVTHYVTEMDSHRDTIRANDHEDPLAIRARIVLGRDGSDAERKALRAINGQLRRIEILTYDAVLRTANRVIQILDGSEQDRSALDESADP